MNILDRERLSAFVLEKDNIRETSKAKSDEQQKAEIILGNCAEEYRA